ncbi:hypothetical protein HYX15_00680 [Candidatus Woesearchaeota archaeon]|nr:hypothetical protein [Candidatus Woesearchaeota archaeon]
MRTIYIIHSRDFDFKNELYSTIRKSQLNKQYNFVLPHEKSDKLFDSKELFKSGCDIVIVESSYPKIGVGIEVGWADAYNIPIIAIYKKGFKISSSIKFISEAVIEYNSSDDMVSKLRKVLERI